MASGSSFRSGAYTSIVGTEGDTTLLLGRPNTAKGNDQNISASRARTSSTFGSTLRPPESPDDNILVDEGFATLERESWSSWLLNRGRRRMLLFGFATCLVATIFVVLGAVAFTSAGESAVLPGVKPPYDEALRTLFVAQNPTISWFQGGLDGSYVEKDANRNIVLKHIELPNATVLAYANDLVDPYGKLLQFFTYSVSSDMKLILLGTNYHKGWRHSFFADYWLYDVLKRRSFLLTRSKTGKQGQNEPGNGQVPLIKFSNNGHNLAYVRDNDVYMLINGSIEMRFTADGSTDILNGLADWVYEEEVYGSADAMWFSPDGLQVAYVKFNDTLVPEYPLLYHVRNHNGEPVGAYPSEVKLKYPKPGYPNPVVSVHVADSTRNASFPVIFEGAYFPTPDDLLVTEIDWACPSSCFLIRIANRVQDRFQIYNASISMSSGEWKAVLIRDEKTSDGAWYNNLQPTHILQVPNTTYSYYKEYAELRDKGGWMHIGMYNQSAKSSGLGVENWLTSGSFDVVSISAIDYELGLVYYLSTEEGPLQRHLYSVTFDGKNKTKLTPPSATDIPEPVIPRVHPLPNDAGYYDARFSPKAKYYVLSYEGPDVPWTRVVRYDGETIKILANNQNVRNAYTKYAVPTRSYITIPNEDAGVDMNAMVVYPADFDASKQYPLLVQCYGGPSSQLAAMKYSIDFSINIASQGVIVASIDGRGTDFMGRDYRNAVSGKLGELEAYDQIVAAKFLRDLPYVADNKIAIWGWSFGGYLTSKVIEADSGVFQLGMAVAPVTDWLLYDTIYTERYMKTPAQNPEGYRRSAVWNMTGFKNCKFLLIHGSADDNVHFGHSLRLLWLLTNEHVANYTSKVIADADHSMGAGGGPSAYSETMSQIKRHLFENFDIR
ncbi:hypothetical protein SeMB42_g00054 [Synchytrium endobioticum]|uniref:Dipeptidyl-peptidase IV n=1 Tax=Synchytrium endobioticum TaxID=286115 RepID=A0A507DVJ8_9FUNG|nr:hypothetical protein SeLEV6574_g02716 [Synchytrium endobioticum]TPX54978.1 hypothetical protein SeMB42_g00054 [Synchytrium endobioticum]